MIALKRPFETTGTLDSQLLGTTRSTKTKTWLLLPDQSLLNRKLRP